jgi:hypothetical protein
MATTIIDELLVTLNLDPKNFTQGQQQATQALRQFPAQANTAVPRYVRLKNGSPPARGPKRVRRARLCRP